MRDAREEMTKLMALVRVEKGFQCNVPIAVDTNIRIGDEVLVYREKAKRWMGPFFVTDVSRKVVFLDIEGKKTILN